MHRVIVNIADNVGERRLGDSVEAVAVHDRVAIEADPVVVDVDFCGKAARGRGDFGDRDQGADIEHFRSS